MYLCTPYRVHRVPLPLQALQGPTWPSRLGSGIETREQAFEGHLCITVPSHCIGLVLYSKLSQLRPKYHIVVGTAVALSVGWCWVGRVVISAFDESTQLLCRVKPANFPSLPRGGFFIWVLVCVPLDPGELDVVTTYKETTFEYFACLQCP